jgi:hypothetical protein
MCIIMYEGRLEKSALQGVYPRGYDEISYPKRVLSRVMVDSSESDRLKDYALWRNVRPRIGSPMSLFAEVKGACEPLAKSVMKAYQDLVDPRELFRDKSSPPSLNHFKSVSAYAGAERCIGKQDTHEK